MSRAMKSSLFSVIAWSIVGMFMISIFTTEGTIQQWGDNTTKTVLLAILFFFGFATDLILRILEKTDRFGFQRDERDMTIQSKAMSIGFIIVLLYIFLLSISLYTKYETAGLMPVGYVWFIAYSTIIMANLSVGLPTLWLYRKQGY